MSHRIWLIRTSVSTTTFKQGDKIKYLQHSLLPFVLAAFMLGCGTESDEPPLIPEIVSIEIDDTLIHNYVYSLPEASKLPRQLTATVTYSDDTPDATVTSELDWESNDTSAVVILNGLYTPLANEGTVAISASYRDALHTLESKTIEIIPLKDVNITSIEDPKLDINYTNIPASADVNLSGVYKLSANGTFADTETINAISSNIIWTSSNIDVATIDSTGSLTVNEINGTVDINVSVYNDINYSIELNVTTAP